VIPFGHHLSLILLIHYLSIALFSCFFFLFLSLVYFIVVLTIGSDVLIARCHGLISCTVIVLIFSLFSSSLILGKKKDIAKYILSTYFNILHSGSQDTLNTHDGFTSRNNISLGSPPVLTFVQKQPSAFGSRRRAIVTVQNRQPSAFGSRRRAIVTIQNRQPGSLEPAEKPILLRKVSHTLRF